MVSNRHSAIESNNAFTAKVEDLVKEIVIQNNILYYRIESSVEHLVSEAGENNYMPVIRIITYFEDTVSQIADLLTTEFEMVAESAVDKKKSRVESFSYKHIQYLVRLKANRRELTEYKRSGDKKFEIQICSMLQDAWAGIEKELGYDSASFPEEGKRDLYRVGALLEMADIEFLKIRSKFIIEPAVTKPTAVTNEPAPVYAPPVYNAPAPVQQAVTPQPEAKTEMTQAQETPVYTTTTAPEIIVNETVEQPVFTPQPEAAAYFAPPAPQYIAPVAEYKIPDPVPVPQPKAAAPVTKPEAFAPPAGLAPKPTNMSVAEHIAAAAPVAAIAAVATPIIENIMSAPAASVAEQTKAIIEEKIPEPAAPVAQAITNHVMPEPIAAAIPEVTKFAPIPVMQQEAPAPVQQPVFNAEQPKEASVENLKVSATGNIETAPEVTGEESSMPFFEDLLLVEEQSKSVAKPTALDENAPITDASLKEYVLKSKILKDVDSQIAERAGAKINGDIDIEGDVERLRFLKVYTLKQLHDRLKDNSMDIVAFAEKWIGKDNGGSFDSGISLFYLEYLLVGKKNDPAFAVEYVVKFISDNDYSARYIIPTYNSIRNTEAPNFSHLTLK